MGDSLNLSIQYDLSLSWEIIDAEDMQKKKKMFIFSNRFRLFLPVIAYYGELMNKHTSEYKHFKYLLLNWANDQVNTFCSRWNTPCKRRSLSLLRYILQFQVYFYPWAKDSSQLIQ